MNHFSKQRPDTPSIASMHSGIHLHVEVKWHFFDFRNDWPMLLFVVIPVRIVNVWFLTS